MKKQFPYEQLLKELISIPAISRQEQERADHLELFLSRWGMDVKRIHNNLLVGDPENTERVPRIVMNSHLDTVPPAEGWQSDPYTPRAKKGRITGLGSNDAGASVVAMISAFHAMRSVLEGKMHLMLLLSAEEEVSGSKGITAVLPLLGKPDGVIVGEPTGMSPAVAERGLMVIDAEVKGKAGHAAREEGINAIYLAMKDIESIQNIDFKDASEWLPEPGAQVTIIEGGSKHNVVPDVCRYVLDVRSNDRYDNERLLDMLRGCCSATLVPRSMGLNPSWLGSDHFLMDAIASLGLSPFGSSTLSDMALIPFPAVKMGPGDSSRSHTADEYILIEEVEEGIDRYKQFLEAAAGAWKGRKRKNLENTVVNNGS